MRTAAKGPGRPSIVDYDDLPNSALRLREAAKKTRREVAAEIGVTTSALCEYELHGNGLGHDLRWKLSFALGVSLERMLKPGKNFAEKVRQRLDMVR